MKIKRKLFGLWTGELKAALVFAALWVGYLNEFSYLGFYLTTFSSVYAFMILEFILFQGSLYWFMKWKRVRRKEDSHLPSSYIQLFLLFKKMNKILLV
ncbi:hypothetical protein [Priestia megaterium]|uniref:hypothetical protein n=1 Tax=Priestia megaterium TaxID=1404 RepID=UPI0004B0E09F|nr:hypothetical protein [Priestia megaterium]TCN16128.1 hypothetical protein EV581_101960 [Bacillus sp. BK006]